MMIEITEWHRKNPNYWCALDKNTNEVIDTDCDLIALAERMDAEGKMPVFCKNWSRPFNQNT